MNKKIFCPKANVSKGKRWTIDYTINADGHEIRSRKDFRLNEIEDLELRDLVATRLAAALEEFSFTLTDAPAEKKKVVKLSAAFQLAFEARTGGARKNSDKHFKAVKTYLAAWAGERGLWNADVAAFTAKDAKAWRVWLKKQRTYTGRTLNNYTNAAATLWNEMMEQGNAAANPWTKLKAERVTPKKRRIYNEHERATLPARLRQENYFLFLAVLLLYYCSIRISEMVRLRRHNFFLDSGLVCVDECSAKMWVARWATIPQSVLHFFRDPRFSKIPAKDFWLGQHWEPNPTKCLNPNSLDKSHRSFLKKMVSEGVIESTDGLTLYGWKDTGITVHLGQTSLLSTRDQAGHTDIKQTMQYYHKSKVNTEYRDLPDTLHLVRT